MTQVAFLLKTEQQDFLLAAKKTTANFPTRNRARQVANNRICSWHSRLTKQTNNLTAVGKCQTTNVYEGKDQSI